MVLAVACSDPEAEEAAQLRAEARIARTLLDALGLPYSVDEAAEHAAAICGFLDRRGQGDPEATMEAAQELLYVLLEDAVNPASEYQDTASVSLDVFPMADVWCPHHEQVIGDAIDAVEDALTGRS